MCKPAQLLNEFDAIKFECNSDAVNCEGTPQNIDAYKFHAFTICQVAMKVI